jgi:hypothetical protein
MASPAAAEQTGAQIIDGKAIAASIRQELAVTVREFGESSGVTPGLAVVLVGELHFQLRRVTRRYNRTSVRQQPLLPLVMCAPCMLHVCV